MGDFCLTFNTLSCPLGGDRDAQLTETFNIELLQTVMILKANSVIVLAQ